MFLNQNIWWQLSITKFLLYECALFFDVIISGAKTYKYVSFFQFSRVVSNS